MQPLPQPTEGGDQPEASPAPTVRLDFLAGLVLLTIAAFFLLGAGEGTLDWVFPTTLSYGVGILGVVLVIRALFGYSERISIIPPILRRQRAGVAVFILVMVVYVLLIRPVGFWPSSVLMIFAAAAYLAPERSRRSVAIAAGAAVVASLLSYILLEYIFYVPFPEPRWLPF